MASPLVAISSLSAKLDMVSDVRDGFEQWDDACRILGLDANPRCPARDVVDQFMVMPPLEEIVLTDFIDALSRLEVTHIIPSRDGELVFYASHSRAFAEAGIAVMICSEETVSRCLDKYAFYQFNCSDYPVIETSLSLDDSVSSWVVKERFGSGSSGLLLNVSKHLALQHAKNLQHPIYQPFVEGQEYSVDIYISRRNICMGCVVRRRDKVINGEAIVTSSIRHSEIAILATRFALDNGLQGHCLVQIIEDISGALHIVEINARYGGSSKLSISLGLNSFYWFALESSGELLDGMELIEYPANRVLDKESKQGGGGSGAG